VCESWELLSVFTHFISTRLRRWNWHSVPKRRLLNPIRREQPILSTFTHFLSTRLWRWNRHNVPKRRLLNTIRRGTTQTLPSQTSYPLAYKNRTPCSETSAIKHHTSGNNQNSLPSHTSYPFAYEDGTPCSETSAIKHHTPGNNQISLPSHTSYPVAYEDGTPCSETSSIKHHTPWNNQNSLPSHTSYPLAMKMGHRVPKRRLLNAIRRGTTKTLPSHTSYPLAYKNWTPCSETSAIKRHTTGNNQNSTFTHFIPTRLQKLDTLFRNVGY
jgi:hypothetical protein